jgi:hypothetical protein
MLLRLMRKATAAVNIVPPMATVPSNWMMFCQAEDTVGEARFVGKP